MPRGQYSENHSLYFSPWSDLGELLPGDEAVPVLVEQLEGGVGLAGPVAPGGTLGPAHHLNLVTGQGGF